MPTPPPEAGRDLRARTEALGATLSEDLSAVSVESNPVPTRTNPLGVKGAGEAGTVGAMPALANAIVYALSEFGVRDIAMPATPERIWRAIRDGATT